MSPALAPGIPACAHNVTLHAGGNILGSPQLNRIFWGSWFLTTEDSFDSQWRTLAATPAFWLRIREYGVGYGLNGTKIDYPGGTTGLRLSDGVFQAGITQAIITSGTTPVVDNIYVVFLPANTSSDMNVSLGKTGHHGHYLALINGIHYDIHYAIIENFANAASAGPVTSHEIMEAATDPDQNAWFDDAGSADGGEIGDFCEEDQPRPANNNYIASYHVQTVWSQRGCRCVPELDLNGVNDMAGLHPVGQDANQFGGFSNETVFRPSNVTWYPLQGTTYLFGSSNYLPFAGDYNGDGRTEFSSFGGGLIHNLDVGTGVGTTVTLGQAGDIPVPGDYNGDGLTDNAVWRPSDGTWHIILSNPAHTSYTTQWGLNGDFPVAADYDADGITDLAVYRPTQSGSNACTQGNTTLGCWYVLPSTTPGFSTWQQWGLNGDVPVPGDYNSDGMSDWAVWRPTEGNFYIFYKNNGFSYSYQLGQWGDIPVVRDYDYDWFTDLSVWRPSNTGDNWFVVTSRDWTFKHNQWGLNGDKPIQRSWLAYPP